MICFAKDLGAFEGESKYDMLAVAVARSIGVETKFYAPDVVPKVAITQFGDGLVRRAEGKRNVYIFHDWYESYKNQLGKYDKAIFLGRFDHPSFECSCVLESYPVARLMGRPADPKGQILICGEYEERCRDWLVSKVKELCSESPLTVRVACPWGGIESNIFSQLVQPVGKLLNSFYDIEERYFASVDLLGEYMAAARHIIHCGGHRGMVHSMAVSTKKCVSYTGDDSFVPTLISELNARLLPLCR
jgi:hypothetical protein